MTSQERVIKTIKREKPDRVPIMHQVLAASIFKHGKKLIKILEKYPEDYTYWTPPIDTKSKHWADNFEGYTDDWGCYWKRVQRGISGQVTGHPLSDWNNFKNYKFPDPYKSIDLEQAKESLRKNEKEKKYMMGIGYKFFDQLIRLRGYEKALVDIIEENDIFKILLRKILDYNLNGLEYKMQLDADGFAIVGEDWGTQNSLIINPSLWRKYFKPAYKRMIALGKKKGMFIHFHSDGNVEEIIPDFVEIGVDVVNFQLGAMDMDKLGDLYHKKLTFRGGVDRQKILPYGSTNEVRNHIKRIMRNFWDRDGGYIACGEIGSDVPLRNVEAMYEAFLEFGN